MSLEYKLENWNKIEDNELISRSLPECPPLSNGSTGIPPTNDVRFVECDRAGVVPDNCIDESESVAAAAAPPDTELSRLNKPITDFFLGCCAEIPPNVVDRSDLQSWMYVFYV